MHMLSQVLRREQAQNKQISTVDQSFWVAVFKVDLPQLRCRRIKRFAIEVIENT